ncbi:GPI-anchored beta-1,3-endoglucanase EglC [Aspergillus lucknowensis]|uniref:Probable glucan endo-1,3-beta-glucosidase eglC n=1 Tax=Aspergillus lucknowensis TaxID=176173 RepID=A0ABR4LNV3_9EURO
MFSKTQILTLALAVASAEAASKGFNYGATKPDGSIKAQADFQSEFQTAKNLKGAPGFSSARLYTMIQGGSVNTPISAIPAAIAEDTTLLLGLWASGGGIDNEIAALKAAIDQYGEEFTKLVVGISVGSEDLYRNSEIGVQADAGIGVEPEELVSSINRVREAISGTSLSDARIGHVDTWNAWTNGSNAAVIEACDWLGFDGYPYFQNTMANSISNAKALFDDSVAKTQGVANGKEVWITETGWPVSGDQENLATASVENAKTFWNEVGCPLFDNVNTWWYILQDASGASTPNPSFGLVGGTLSTEPLFDLSCSGSSSSSALDESTTTPAESTSVRSTSVQSSSVESSGFYSTTKTWSATPTHAGSNLGSSDSFPSGSGHQAGASSVTVSPSISSPSSSATASPTQSAGAGTGSGSGSNTGGSEEPSTSTSPDSPDFTGAGTRLSGSVFGAALLVAALVAV